MLEYIPEKRYADDKLRLSACSSCPSQHFYSTPRLIHAQRQSSCSTTNFSSTTILILPGAMVCLHQPPQSKLQILHGSIFPFPLLPLRIELRREAWPRRRIARVFLASVFRGLGLGDLDYIPSSVTETPSRSR